MRLSVHKRAPWKYSLSILRKDIFCIDGPNYFEALWMQVFKGPSKVSFWIWVTLSKGMGRRLEHRLKGTSQGSGVAHCCHGGGSGHRSPYLCLHVLGTYLGKCVRSKECMKWFVLRYTAVPLTVSTATTSHHPLHRTIGKRWALGVTRPSSSGTFSAGGDELRHSVDEQQAEGEGSGGMLWTIWEVWSQSRAWRQAASPQQYLDNAQPSMYMWVGVYECRSTQDRIHSAG